MKSNYTFTLYLALFATFFSLKNSFSQYSYDELDMNVIVYTTYDDFTNEKGTKIGELYDYTIQKVFGIPTIALKVKNNGEKERVDIKNEWGFSVGEYVFRVVKGAAFKLVFLGKNLAYFENGSAHLTAIIDDEETLFFPDDGIRFLFCTGINEDAYTISQFKNKFKTNPIYTEICECLDQFQAVMSSNQFSSFLSAVRDCADKFIDSESK